jgi:hypothetical protein
VVNIRVVANNEKDPFDRRWVVTIDKLPPLNWPLSANFDGTSFVETHSQGELMQTSLSLPNGKHVVYFAVSVPNGSEWGTYSGGVQMDGVSGEFTGIDVDTVAAFEIEVKDNKVTKRVNQQATELGETDQKAKAFFVKAKDKIVDNAKLVVGATAVGVVVIIGSLLGVKAMNKRRI